MGAGILVAHFRTVQCFDAAIRNDQVKVRLENGMSIAKRRVIEEARFQMKKLEEEKQAAIRNLKVRSESGLQI